MASGVRLAWLSKVVFGIIVELVPGAAGADVVAVVSTANPVSMLSRNQAADIFLGRSRHFPDGSVTVPVDQSEGSATRDEFYADFTGKSAAQVKAHWSRIIFTGRGQPPQDVANGAAVKRFVATHPNAIGYIEKSEADSSVKILPVH